MNHDKPSHTHCWEEQNPPCGKKAHARCCLCEEGIPQSEYNLLEAYKQGSLETLRFLEKRVESINVDGGGNGRRIKEQVLAIIKQIMEQ